MFQDGHLLTEVCDNVANIQKGRGSFVFLCLQRGKFFEVAVHNLQKSQTTAAVSPIILSYFEAKRARNKET